MSGHKVMIQIDLPNHSTVVSDFEAAKAVRALQRQVSGDFAPAWGIDALLHFIPNSGECHPGHWQLPILDDSDQAGALGYHDLSSEGLPIGKVFAKTSVINGTPWSRTASHEVLEMLADPTINLTVFIEQLALLVAYENCDGPEHDRFGYEIDGIPVSDFVFPSWFENFWSPGATQLDFRRHVDRPLKILPGGYIGTYSIRDGNGWQQILGEQLVDGVIGSINASSRVLASTVHFRGNRHARAPIGSRRERRRTPVGQWLRSTR